MARRIYKSGCLVEARNTKYEKGFVIILSGPYQPESRRAIPEFDVHWFERPSIIDHWEWNMHRNAPNGMGVHTFKMTQNQIVAVRPKKS